jgi:hypothetical protein
LTDTETSTTTITESTVSYCWHGICTLSGDARKRVLVSMTPSNNLILDNDLDNRLYH